MTSSAFAQNLALNFLFVGGDLSSPGASGVYVGLLDANGDELTSSATNYARQSITFAGALAGVVRNSSDLTWTVPDPNWGQIAGYAIYTAATAGTLLVSGSLDPLAPDGVNDLVIEAGELEITLE